MSSRIGVIFDLDGTLADTADVIEQSCYKTLAELEIAYSGKLDILWGAPMDAVIERLSEVVGQKIPHDKFLSIHDAYHLQLFGTPRQQYEGRVAAIDALVQNDIAVAVATSSPKDRAHHLLDACGYHFDHIVTRDCVVRGKPHPDSFLKAAELIGVRSEHCIVVEDAPVGIQAAYAAGMKSIGIRTREQDLTILEQGPHKLLDSVTQITPQIVYSFVTKAL